MFNKKILAASMAAAISTGMVAQSHAMKMQANNLGQMLLSPIYVTTADGLNSEITVVNTRTDAAVKAKVVFREALNSSEVLDFIIYLTPGDVWRAKVSGPMEAAVLESSDDSMTNNSGVFVSADNPLSQPFFDKEGSGVNGMGHIEVFGVYSITTGITRVPAPSNNGVSPVVVEQGMEKIDLKALFDRITETNGDKDSISIQGDVNSAIASSVDPERLQLFGEVSLTDGASTTFTDMLLPAMGPDDYADADTYVIQNEDFDAQIAQDTPIGRSFGPNGEDLIADVEWAIAATDISGEYNVDNSDLAGWIVSFVTKYRHRFDTAGVSGCAPASTTLRHSSPFDDTTVGGVINTFTSFDNMENSEVIVDGQFSGGTVTTSILPFEVNFIVPTYFSTSGWAKIDFSKARPGCYYQGAPVLAAVLKSGGPGFSMIETADRPSKPALVD